MTEDETTPEPDSMEDPFADLRQAKPWLDAIAEAEKAFDQYQKKCDNIAKTYANLREMSADSGERQLRMFWANLEVLKPSVYARKPVPVVTPRFKNRKSLPRTAADVLERCLIASYDLENLHGELKDVRDDLVLTGRGAMWLRHDVDGETGVEGIRYEHVNRRDFLHNPARKWSEVEWVARRAYLDQDRGEARFGEAWKAVKAKQVKSQATEGSKGDLRGAVWEIWHKTKGLVVWVSPDADELGAVLDVQEPPFRLHRFFPCPKPAYATCEPETLRPVPDFVFYRDQLEEINELTARISHLSEALKMKGFYAAGASEIGDAIEAALKAHDNNAVLVPVSNWAAIGGASLKDSIVWLPVVEVAQTIKELVGLRQQLITDVYQITGISDIMRGNTEASETATAQQIKAQYGNVRVRERQDAMINLALDVTEIAAEMMAENFMPETLKSFSQIDDVPDQAQVQQQIMAVQQQVMAAMQSPGAQAMAAQAPDQAQQLLQQAEQQVQTLQNTVTWEQVAALLKDQKIRPFVLDIETNSTIQPDEQADKQSRAEAITALGGFLSSALPVVQAAPETGQFMAEALKWFGGGFRMGRAMDTAIDTFADQMTEFSKQPKPPPPEMVKAQNDAAARDKELALDAKKHEDEMALKSRELDLKSMEAEHRADMENKTLRFNATKEAANGMAAEDAVARESQAEDAEAAKLDDIARQVKELAAMIDAVAKQLQPTLQ